jgi:diguanylate cyclase (GGDEF)-like protein
MTRRLRETDYVARLGDDEFAALVLDLNAVHEARQIATDLTRAIASQSIITTGGAAQVTVSIGVVPLDQKTCEGELDSLVAGDNAMYRAKRAGRNRISLAA